MKKYVSLFFVVIFVFVFAVGVSAGDDVKYTGSKDTYPCEDGGYIAVTLRVYRSGATKRSDVSAHKSLSKTNSAGELLWEYTLYGSFVYDGSASTCIDVWYDYSIEDSSWSFSDGDAYALGNTAYGEGVFTEKFLFITLQTYDADVNIVCDANGNVY